MTATPSLPRRSAAEQARVETLLQEMFEHRIRFNEVLGLRVESFDPANPRLLPQRLRRLFGRTRLDRMEYNLLRGILGRVQALRRGDWPPPRLRTGAAGPDQCRAAEEP